MKYLYKWALPFLCLILSTISLETVNAAIPHADFTFEISGNTVTFTNLSNDATSYIWEFGDGTSSQDNNPIHNYTADGNYLVKLKASNSSGTAEDVQVAVIGNNYQQYPYNANEFVPPYDKPFRPGTNLGYNPPWNDKQLADLSAGNEALGVPGIGAKTIRPFLPDYFLEEYGYDVRLEEFEHYASLDLDDNTLIVGFPSEEHRDPTFHCSDTQSETFDNMYTDIWDNGENGTPVNDDNHLALYIYKLVHLYGDKITFWEIWNEPGFDFTYSKGWLPPGEPGNWWDNNPDPCDYKLHAPIFHYVRILRICYEVIKYVDPNAYITLGSVGFPSFMDAVLRNTDNPNDGSPNNTYPLGGGAYFDVVSIHSYPHFDGTLREWNNDIQDFDYFRHSDKAASGIKRTKDFYETVLYDYGYDGNTFPEKHWIITEINIPRQPFGNAIGSEEAQRNFIIKAYIESIKEGITEMHVYDLAEPFYAADASNPFHAMGLYQRLFDILPYNQIANDEGIAYKTTSDLLFDSSYDPNQTAAMNLPDEIDGAAFLDLNGNYTYVIWAKTSIDQSEVANATYTFPANFDISTLHARQWDFSQTEIETTLSGNGIQLSASPLFLTDDINETLILPTANFELASQNICAPIAVNFNNNSSTNSESWLWTFENGNPSTSTIENPTVTYASSGNYDVTLIVSNPAGSDTLRYENYVNADLGLPEANFSTISDSLLISFVNTSENANTYTWDMDDGFDFEEANPTHSYNNGGYYDVSLVAHNNCGTDTTIQQIMVLPDSIIPLAAFTSTAITGCVPLTVQFFDQSTSNTISWAWLFQDGTPDSSTEQNPIVTFNEPGDFFVRLKAFNVAGDDTEYINDYIIVSDSIPPPIASFNSAIDGNQVNFNNTSIDASSYLWNFGDNNTSTEVNPVHTYSAPGDYIVILIAEGFCAPDTISTTVTIDVSSTIEKDITFQLQIAPNPNNGLFGLQLKGKATPELSLKIYDALGRVVLSREISFESGRFDEMMEISNLAGVYWLAISGDGKVWGKRIVVE